MARITQQKVLDVLKDEPGIQAPEIAKKLGASESAVRTHLARARANGALKRPKRRGRPPKVAPLEPKSVLTTATATIRRNLPDPDTGLTYATTVIEEELARTTEQLQSAREDKAQAIQLEERYEGEANALRSMLAASNGSAKTTKPRRKATRKPRAKASA